MPTDRSKSNVLPHSQSAPNSMQLRRVAVTNLKPAPYNPRVDLVPGHPTFEKLRRSIETFGSVEPIVWNRRTGHVVGGHQRLSVLKHLGHTHVDVVVVELDLPAEKTLNLALNRIVGEWDEGKLAELLKDLTADPSLDLGLTGFDGTEIDHVLANVAITAGLANDDAAFDVAANLQTSKPAIDLPPSTRSSFRFRNLALDHGGHFQWQGSDSARSRSFTSCGKRMWNFPRALRSSRSAGSSTSPTRPTTAGDVSTAA